MVEYEGLLEVKLTPTHPSISLKFQNLLEKLKKFIFLIFLVLTCHSRPHKTEKTFRRIFCFSEAPKFCSKIKKV